MLQSSDNSREYKAQSTKKHHKIDVIYYCNTNSGYPEYKIDTVGEAKVRTFGTSFIDFF